MEHIAAAPTSRASRNPGLCTKETNMLHIYAAHCSGTNKTRTLHRTESSTHECSVLRFYEKNGHHSVVLTQRPRTMNEIVDITTQLCIA